MNSTAAFLLLLLGVLGIYAEFCFPGKAIPGAVGCSLVIYSVAALSSYPVSLLGVALLAGSFALYAFGSIARLRGVTSLLGVGLMVLGSWKLINSSDAGVRIHPWATLLCIPFGLLTAWLFSTAHRARRNKLK